MYENIVAAKDKYRTSFLAPLLSILFVYVFVCDFCCLCSHSVLLL